MAMRFRSTLATPCKAGTMPARPFFREVARISGNNNLLPNARIRKEPRLRTVVRYAAHGSLVAAAGKTKAIVYARIVEAREM
jgi:hypothetical protein